MSTMVIRVWHEPAVTEGFRARLTMSTDGETDRSIVSADTEEVMDAVRAWLTAQRSAPIHEADSPE